MTDTPSTETTDELNPHAPPESTAMPTDMSGELAEAPSEPTPVPGPDSKKPNKNDLKRMRIWQERVQRYMKSHPQSTPADAQKALQMEDYAKLPVDEKLKRTQQYFGLMVGKFQEAVNKQLDSMMQNLYGMDGSMQVNFRAIARVLVNLGISVEDQRKMIAEAEAEIRAEIEEAKKEQQEAEAKAMEQQEKINAAKKSKAEERVNAEATLKDAEKVNLQPKESHPELPPEARVF